MIAGIILAAIAALAAGRVSYIYGYVRGFGQAYKELNRGKERGSHEEE